MSSNEGCLERVVGGIFVGVVVFYLTQGSESPPPPPPPPSYTPMPKVTSIQIEEIAPTPEVVRTPVVPEEILVTETITPKATPVLRTISLRNSCQDKDDIYFVIMYRDIFDKDVLLGHYEIDNDKGIVPAGIQTKSSIIYFYAEERNGRRYRRGGNSETGIIVKVTEDKDDEFKQINSENIVNDANEPYEPNKLKEVVLYPVDISQSSNEHIETFSCREN